MNVSEQRAALENETEQLYQAAKRLAERAATLWEKARRWEFIDTAEDVGGFSRIVNSAARDYLWHRRPSDVLERERQDDALRTAERRQ